MDEFKIIEKYVKNHSGPGLILGKGDDCSIFEYDSKNYLICTTDALVEHKHFRLQDISFEQLGYKSLAVNLSDISAMGGKALWSQLSIAIPNKIQEKDIESFFSGFYKLANQENILLTGGDTTSSNEDLFISITLLGLVEKTKIKLRQNFIQGDLLVVTGFLGDSSAGLKCLFEEKKGEAERPLIQNHLLPQSFHSQAQWLSQWESVKGMMDVSDGLLSDLRRIPQAGFEIDLEMLPLSKELKNCCEKWKWDPMEFALSGGEDYVLLFSCEESSFKELQEKYEKKWSQKLFPIGRVNKSGSIQYLLKGKPTQVSYKPFSHF